MMMPAVALLAAATPVEPACRADRIAITFVGRDGDFNGMSHAGTAVTLRNIGRRPCTLPALPVFRFRDASGRALPIARQVPIGLHPGPMMRPLRLMPGGQATTSLRWVSGAVFDSARCFDVARVGVLLGQRAASAPLAAHVCGPSGGGALVEQPPLTTRGG